MMTKVTTTKKPKPRKLPAVAAKFKKGQLVYKFKGYYFAGAVRSAFTTDAGEWRYVVEHDISGGLLHIFSGDQLKPAPK